MSDLIKECRQSLAECLFAWTCQSPLSKDDTLALIGHLETVTAEADGSLDSVNLALVMALLYCFDVSFLEQGTEDRDGTHASRIFVKAYLTKGCQRVKSTCYWLIILSFVCVYVC